MELRFSRPEILWFFQQLYARSHSINQLQRSETPINCKRTQTLQRSEIFIADKLGEITKAAAQRNKSNQLVTADNKSCRAAINL
jgi:hypothetical protein